MSSCDIRMILCLVPLSPLFPFVSSIESSLSINICRIIKRITNIGFKMYKLWLYKMQVIYIYYNILCLFIFQNNTSVMLILLINLICVLPTKIKIATMLQILYFHDRIYQCYTLRIKIFSETVKEFIWCY